jgi:hypothetical protein
VDDVANGLTAEHRARIEAVLAPEGKVMTPEAWAELGEAVVYYHSFETVRATYDIVKHRKQREHMEEAIDTTILGLCRDDMWPGDTTWWRPDALAAMSAIRRKVEALAAFHDIWSAFGGRQNPHRALLYWGVMRVWTDRLGGELRYSTEGPTHHGPLIRFFVVCVEPVLGEQMPSISTIADIIDRERKARAKTEDEKRQWHERWGGSFDC